MLNPALIVIFIVVVLSIIFIIWRIYMTKLREVRQRNAKLESDLAQTNQRNNLLSNQLEQEHHNNTNLKSELEQERQRKAPESLFSELKQERQRNAKLESNLMQANQRAEDFSSKNKHLASELKQEHQHNVNTKRKLGVSETSLAQACQHNEHLTSALTQANQQKADLESNLAKTNQRIRYYSNQLAQAYQHNEGLSSQLEQERQHNANFDFSAYSRLLDAIYTTKCVQTEAQKRECLWELQKVSKQLGAEYQQSEISPDYSKSDYQEAYLLRYFLPYSQPVPYLLNHLILKKNFPCQLPENQTLTASFFGCGPGPELFGLMRYLGSPQSAVDISAAMFDIQPAWKYARQIVFEHLLDRVWDPSSYRIQEFESNLVGDAGEFLPIDSEESVRESDLIVIQHCLNERHNAKSERLIGNLAQLVRKMKSGAVMLIVERARYASVKDLLGKFRHKLEKEFNSSLNIECKIEGRDGVEIRPILEIIPKELADNFFTEDSSNSVNSVRFIWMAISKNFQL